MDKAVRQKLCADIENSSLKWSSTGSEESNLQTPTTNTTRPKRTQDLKNSKEPSRAKSRAKVFRSECEELLMNKENPKVVWSDTEKGGSSLTLLSKRTAGSGLTRLRANTKESRCAKSNINELKSMRNLSTMKSVEPECTRLLTSKKLPR